MTSPNADYGARYWRPHPVFAPTWNAPDPWPICLDCGSRVYLADEWLHFDPSLNGRLRS